MEDMGDMDPAASDETTRRILVPTRRGRHRVIVRQYPNPAIDGQGQGQGQGQLQDDADDNDADAKVTPEERQLLDALAVSEEELFQRESGSSCISDLRPEALHLVGLTSMSTEDVFDLLQPLPHHQPPPPWPQWLEWVNDNACNAVYRGPRHALAALARLCYCRHHRHHLVEDSCQTAQLLLRVSGGSRCLRSWDGRVLARFANADGDVKANGANHISEYYRRHGNPNYGNLAGVISQSYRRRVNAERDDLEMLALASSSEALAASERQRLLRRRKLSGQDSGESATAKRPRRQSPSPSGDLGDLRQLLRQAAAASSVSLPSPSPPPPSRTARYRVRRQFLARGGTPERDGSVGRRRLASVIVRPPPQQQKIKPKIVVVVPASTSRRRRSRSRSSSRRRDRRPSEVEEAREVSPSSSIKWEPAGC